MAYINDFGDSVAINMSHQQMKDLKDLLNEAVTSESVDGHKKESYQQLYYAIDNFEYEQQNG
ncbi:MAG: hypothetical protein J6O49_01170 [Bacteroidaceae bacterium]|nr:hypothetical protein [Bacteroidaceae bacterium]